MKDSGVKDRLGAVLGLVRTVVHWGYIPTILYLGIKKGADPGCPEVTIMRALRMACSGRKRSAAFEIIEL